MTNKLVYDNKESWQFMDPDGNLNAAYIPNLAVDEEKIMANLLKLPFNRVEYISPYQSLNKTPRQTWCFGKTDANCINPDFDPNSPEDKCSKLVMICNPNATQNRESIPYRNLDFEPEIMPEWLEELSQFCRRLAVNMWGFDPCYNSCIIGKYENGKDQIAFHFDTETFLAHHFCANVTFGQSRDFQFRTNNADGTRFTHEIELDHKSVFFFLGLEHALPKRAGVGENSIRYSISFRNMANNIGIGNSYYYCRGVVAAIDNERKRLYLEKLTRLQQEKALKFN
jgi:alkylated DNA repair dioxygenase AlkB